MSGTDQLTFKDIEIGEKQTRSKALADDLQRRLKATAITINRNEFSAVVDKAYTTVSGVLNTNSEKAEPFPTNWIPAVILENPDLFMTEVWNTVAAWCGYKPSPGKVSKLTPEQELESLKKKIKDHGLEKIFEW